MSKKREEDKKTEGWSDTALITSALIPTTLALLGFAKLGKALVETNLKLNELSAELSKIKSDPAYQALQKGEQFYGKVKGIFSK